MVKSNGVNLYLHPNFSNTGADYTNGVVFNPAGLTMGRGRYIKLGIRYLQNVTNAGIFRIQVARNTTAYTDITSSLSFPTGNAGEYKEVNLRITDITSVAFREYSNIDQVRITFPTAPNGQTAISLFIS